MKAADRTESSPSLETLPSFDLDYYVDDRDDPTRIMVMPVSLTLGSSEQWISIDADHAVALDEVR